MFWKCFESFVTKPHHHEDHHRNHHPLQRDARGQALHRCRHRPMAPPAWVPLHRLPLRHLPRRQRPCRKAHSRKRRPLPRAQRPLHRHLLRRRARQPRPAQGHADDQTERSLEGTCQTTQKRLSPCRNPRP